LKIMALVWLPGSHPSCQPSAEPVATKPGQVMSVAATTEMAAAAKLRWEKIKAAKTAKLK
jgi:hypothetical protein